MMAEHQTRRRWVKLWTQETLHGTTLRELLPDERAVWFELLCLAGDSVIPGCICIAENIPYTDDQLSMLLAVDKDLLKRAMLKMQQSGKIRQNGTGVIEVCNFIQYQGEFDKTAYMANYMPEYRAGLRRRDKDGKTDVKSNTDKSNGEISNNAKSNTDKSNGEISNNAKSVEQTRQEHIILDKKDIRDIYIVLFSIWNAQKIIVHKELNAPIKKAIDKALKTYSEGQISSAIVNYGTIVTHPEEYRWTYKWSLQEFLTRENAIVKFLDGDVARNNYRKSDISKPVTSNKKKLKTPEEIKQEMGSNW